jgi:hypothetical protein
MPNLPSICRYHDVAVDECVIGSLEQPSRLSNLKASRVPAAEARYW